MHHADHDPQCAACEGGGMENYHAHMRELIKRHQVAIAGVLPDAPDALTFAYTVGLSLHGLPEILMIANYAIPLPSMQTVLNEVAFRWLKEGHATLGVNTDTLKPFNGIPMPVELVLVDPEEARQHWTVQVEPVLGQGHAYTVAQLILPDDHGYLPSMAGYNPTNFPQVLLPPCLPPPVAH